MSGNRVNPGDVFVLGGETLEVVSTFAGGNLVTLRPPAPAGGSPTRYRPATRTVNRSALTEQASS